MVFIDAFVVLWLMIAISCHHKHRLNYLWISQQSVFYTSLNDTQDSIGAAPKLCHIRFISFDTKFSLFPSANQIGSSEEQSMAIVNVGAM